MFQVLRYAMLKSQCVIDGDGIACEQLDHIIGFPNPPKVVRAPLTGEEVATNLISEHNKLLLTKLFQ
jgi:hypothetical protein